jgi:hypothetical protein
MDVERLIACAYSGFEPPPSLEEEVRAALPADREVPRRSLAVFLVPVAALLAFGVALALARGNPAPLGDGGEPDLPAIERPAGDVGGDGTVVRVCRDGRILVPPGRPGADWERVTLDGLATHLRREAEAFHRREAAAGRNGYDKGVSRLRVDLQVDRETPWLHVQWVMTVCAEERMPRLAFAARANDAAYLLDASLPTDLPLERDPPVVSVSVRVSHAPAGVRYRIGEQETGSLASLVRLLVDAQTAAALRGAALQGEIRAARDIPFARVAELVAEFRRAGIEHVHFFGAPVPDPETRRAKGLPRPGGTR